VAVVHHMNKSGGTRGSSAIRGDTDSLFLIANDSITSDKLKAEKDGPIPYSLSRKILGVDTDGDEISDVAVNELATADGIQYKADGLAILNALEMKTFETPGDVAWKDLRQLFYNEQGIAKPYVSNDANRYNRGLEWLEKNGKIMGNKAMGYSIRKDVM
jgi:hypothetical protein